MTDKKHTPGPWKWDIRDDDYVDTDPLLVRHLDNRDSASGAGFTLEGKERSVLIPWDLESYSAGVYIRQADARLIAAAPDLLEALLEWERLNEVLPLDSRESTTEIYWQCRAKSEIAIAKAMG